MSSGTRRVGELRSWLSVGVALITLSVLVGTASPARAFDRDVYEARLQDSLRQMEPAMVDPFVRANEASEREEFAEAARLYQQVRDQVPGFSAATRRLCGVELARGNHQRAVDLCREALNAEDLAENQAALAHVLLNPANGEPSASVRREALALAGKAVNRKQDDPANQAVLCEAAVKNDELATLRTCSAALQRLDPKDPYTHVFSSLVRGADGDFEGALGEVEEARRHGLPDETYAALRSGYEDAQPWHSRWGGLILRVGLGWLAGLVLLFGAGALLSRSTVRAASKAPTESGGQATGLDRFLRRTYRAVLWICCAYYYLSLPLVLLAVVAVAAGVIYGMLLIGHISIKLVVIALVFALVTIGALLKSLFVRPKDEDPGERLNLDDHPRLREVLHEVAARIGTRPVDSVFLTPETDVAVFERGGLLRQLTGRTERCLVLGAGALDGFPILPFKAVLAHEYGHFHNEDTAGGGFALAVRRSVMVMGASLAEGGAAVWYNPAWLFLNGFLRLFLRISHGASRLQEVLADRWAAFAYGADAFAAGLRHVIERSIRFDTHVQLTLSEVIENQRGLANLYHYEPSGEGPEEEAYDKAIEQAINEPPSPYASHPSPVDRIRWIRLLPPASLRPGPDDDLEAWTLLDDREAIEKRMTNRVREAVEVNHGVVIPEEDGAANAGGDTQQSCAGYM